MIYVTMLLWAAALYLALRASIVARAQRRALKAVGKYCDWLIANGEFNEWPKEYEYYLGVGFDEMMVKFWRRPESFYDWKRWQIPGEAPKLKIVARGGKSCA